MDANNCDDIKTVIIGVVIAVNITLNVTVLAVFLKYPEIREDRSTLFMLSLTISDLANGCSAMPIGAAVCSCATPEVQLMTSYLPRIQQLTMVWFTINSMHSLCWMTVCKMLAITQPFRYEQLLTLNRCCVIVGCTWLTGGLLATALAIGRASWSFKTCTYELEGTPEMAVIFLVSVAIGIVIPVIIILYATVRILCVIIRTHLQIASQVNSIGGQIGVSATLTSVTLKSLRSGRNVLIICASYVILAIPFAVHACAALLGSGTILPDYYTFVAIWIMMCGTSINSLVYLIYFRDVRRKTALMISTLFDIIKCW